MLNGNYWSRKIMIKRENLLTYFIDTIKILIGQLS